MTGASASERSGRRVNSPVGHLFEFRDGKVVRYINLVNTAAYLEN